MFVFHPSLQTLSPEGSTTDDFLDALLGESDSSATASPLWSPCTTDSGINEDPLTDPTESLHPPSCTAFPAFDTQSFHPPPPLEYQPLPNEKTPYVSIDLGKTGFEVKSKIMMQNGHLILARYICETCSYRGNYLTVDCFNSEHKYHHKLEVKQRNWRFKTWSLVLDLLICTFCCRIMRATDWALWQLRALWTSK